MGMSLHIYEIKHDTEFLVNIKLSNRNKFRMTVNTTPWMNTLMLAKVLSGWKCQSKVMWSVTECYMQRLLNLTTPSPMEFQYDHNSTRKEFG